MKKKIWIIIILILIVILGGCYFYIKNSKTQDVHYGNLERSNQTTNTEQNTMQNEEKNTVTNTVTKPEENTQKENTTSSETLPENPKTAEEKSIDIVKKDYGTPTGISFRVEGMDNSGKYIVKVINIDTTQVLEYYFVDVATGTFTK